LKLSDHICQPVMKIKFPWGQPCQREGSSAKRLNVRHFPLGFSRPVCRVPLFVGEVCDFDHKQVARWSTVVGHMTLLYFRINSAYPDSYL